MPNGKMTTRDYVIEIHTKLESLKKDFEDHKKNHRWIIGLMFLVPGVIYYILKLLEKL